jgi:hypothetical protein
MSYSRRLSAGSPDTCSAGRGTTEIHEDGTYVVSMTRFEKDDIHITNPTKILSWLEKGYGLRMSNPAKGIGAPSLIKPQSIYRPVA